MFGPAVKLTKANLRMENQTVREPWSTRFLKFLCSESIKLEVKGWKYVGEFKNGKFHGTGTFHWNEMNYYEGKMFKPKSK